MTMDYLPEWKIYLWKKLLLKKDTEFEKDFKPADFIFFTEQEKRKEMLDNAQRSIDQINLAVQTRTITNLNGGHTPLEDSYFHSEPKDALMALIELAEMTPAALSIEDIRLNKAYAAAYKKKHGEYLAMEEKKRVASIGMGHPGRKPSDNYFNDKHAGLGPTIYTKIEAGNTLTLAELKSLIATGLPVFDFIIFKLKLNQTEFEKRMNEYLEAFMANSLIGRHGMRYIDPQQQMQNILGAINLLAKKYGASMVITDEEVAKAGDWYLRDEHHYRFYEAMFSLEKSGNIGISDLRKEEVVITLKKFTQEVTIPMPVAEPLTRKEPDTKAEITIGKLVGYYDGSIRYDGKVLDLRPQIKDLCWLFMRRHNQLVNATDIKEQIVKASRRKNTSDDTISKYVSELQKKLKIHFGKSVITNEPKGGWIFNP